MTAAVVTVAASSLPGLFDHDAPARLFPLPVREGVLAGVVPASRLGERPAPVVAPTGIAALDQLADGLPRGALTELCGPASSGRTSVLLAAMAQCTRRQEVCALVDVSDSFDPASAAAAGVDLARVLWVRCAKPSLVVGRQSSVSGQWPVASGRRNRKSEISNGKSAFGVLEQALKATDLLLQGGGFGMVAVDLGDIPTQAARRIPLASWFRFRRAVEHTSTVLLVLEEEPYAKSCASLVVRLAAQPSAVSYQPSAINAPIEAKEIPSHVRLLRGLQIRAEVLCARGSERKPVRSAAAEFASRTAWAG